MKVNFYEDGAVVHELLFKGVDFFERSPPFAFLCKSFDPLDEHTSVPRAVKNGDVAVSGQTRPESAQVMVLILLLGRLADGMDAVEAGIEAFDGPLDCAAFAGSIWSFKYRDECSLRFCKRALVAQKFELSVFECGLVIFLIHKGMIETIEAAGIIPRCAEKFRRHRQSRIRKQPDWIESSPGSGSC